MKPGIAAAIGGVCIVVLSWIAYSQSSSYISTDVEFQLIDGRRLSLAELGRRPLLITFWATTCTVCVKKTPELVKLYQDLHPQGAEMIAVAMSYDPPNRILNYSKIHEIPYPISLDIDGNIARAFDDVSLTPSTFLLDRDGRVVYKRVGEIDVANLKTQIMNLLSTNSDRT